MSKSNKITRQRNKRIAETSHILNETIVVLLKSYQPTLSFRIRYIHNNFEFSKARLFECLTYGF